MAEAAESKEIGSEEVAHHDRTLQQFSTGTDAAIFSIGLGRREGGQALSVPDVPGD
jgi:hypothetical protein